MLELLLKDGIEGVLWFQSLGNWLEAPMDFFTFLGNEEFYLLIMPALYWCLDSALGFRLGILLLLSGGLNSAFKVMAHAPRPFWYDSRVAVHHFDETFGLPSGHAQNAVALWGLLAAEIRRGWAWLLAVLLIVMIGLSRIYLAMHFPVDVFAGWLIGLALLAGFLLLRPQVESRVKEGSTPGVVVQSLVVILLPLALGVAAVSALNASGWGLPAGWIANAGAAFPEEAMIDPLQLAGMVTASGSLAGFILGRLWLRGRGGFDAGGDLTVRALRYVVGVAGVAALWLGLRALFPAGESLAALALRFVRYALVTFWVAGLAPMAFRRLGLAAPATSGN